MIVFRPVSFVAGQMIGGSLRLVRLVGRGAMGSVWIADHLGLDSQVAVKFMAQAMLDDPVSLVRFQQEAKAAAEIRSPHVVRVFDHGTIEDGTPYIVMELLDGESLDRRLKRTGTLSLIEVGTIVRQCCKALSKAHERGIQHRDIKPGNVFLSMDDDLFVKVVDFGVAKFSGQEAIEMTAQGNMIGTPAYMSPEQLFHGRGVDHRGDLWSLAVVAYQALTGQRPFDGTTLGELCVAIKRGEFTAVSAVRADTPTELDSWFGRAFASDVEERFGSAKEMSASFDVASGLVPVGVSNPSLPGHAAWMRGSSPSLPAVVNGGALGHDSSGRVNVEASHPLAGSQLSTFSGSTASESAPRRRQRNLALGGALVALLATAVVVVRSMTSAPAAVPVSLASSGETSSSTADPVQASLPPASPEPTVVASSSASIVDRPAADDPPTPQSSAPPKPSWSVPPPARSQRPIISDPRPPPPAHSDSDERSRRAAEQLGI